ncbi:MAG: hypothetical protein AB1609_21310 [Bacillota bacterium]
MMTPTEAVRALEFGTPIALGVGSPLLLDVERTGDYDALLARARVFAERAGLR